MALALTQIDDVLERLLPRYTRGKYVDISLPLQRYHFAANWFKSKKTPERGGTRLEWKLRTANQNNASDTGLYAIRSVDRKNVMTKAFQEWSMQWVHYSFDIREDDFASGPERILDRMDEQEEGLLNDFFMLMENRMWTAPSSSALDPMPASGIPFWLQKYVVSGTVTATTTPDFLGGDPAGWTSGAGNIATATYPAWKNYCGSYSVVSRDDLIEKIVNGMDYTYFDAPAPFPKIGAGEPEYGCYGVHSTLAEMRRILEKQNDNLGREVAWGAVGTDTVMVRGIPFTWVPALTFSTSEAYDSSDPVYLVNWRLFRYFFKSGENMIKLPVDKAPTQPTVRIRTMLNAGNFCCENRREGGAVFYKV